MEYRLGICDRDYHYVINLMEYINSSEQDKVKLVAFSSCKAMEEYLESNYLDGVILGQGMDIIAGKQGLVIMSLMEEESDGDNQIYKYQSADVIVENVLRCLDVTGDNSPISVQSMVAVYSPLGRCGKTTLAKAIASMYEGSLYISLEEYGERDCLGEDILYHILLKNKSISDLLRKLKTNSYGFVELKGILSYLDIRQLRRDNLEWLRGVLFMVESYSNAVFDIGAGALADLTILNVMDRVYVPIMEDDSSRRKLQAFRELMREKEYRDINEKLVYVNVPVCHFCSENMKDFICKGGF